jgi:hypothetical protein
VRGGAAAACDVADDSRANVAIRTRAREASWRVRAVRVRSTVVGPAEV